MRRNKQRKLSASLAANFFRPETPLRGSRETLEALGRRVSLLGF
jgi:hypothetical protein